MPVEMQEFASPGVVMIALRFGIAWENGSLSALTAETMILSAGRSGFGGMNSPSGSSGMPSLVPQTVISFSTAE